MEELLPKISALLFKYGVKSLTMDDIARNLAISKKTLYEYFENKADVVLKVGTYEQQNEFEDLAKICNQYTQTIEQFWAITKYLVGRRLKLSSTLLYALNKYYPDVIGNLSASRQAHINGLIVQNINKGIQEGLYRENVEIDTVLFYYAFLLDFTNFEIFENWFKSDSSKRYHAAFNYHLRAIATPKGVQYFETKFKPEVFNPDF